MSNKKSIEASVINSILTLSLLTSCNGSVVNVDKDVVNKLKTEDPNLGQIAESNINHITQVCTEKVDGFISGSENILQIGASAAWSFCDYKDSEGINRRMVVSNQEIGKDENVILLPMRQTVDGKSAGYKDADGNDHYIWAESSDGSQTIVFDFNENQYVLNNDEKQQLSDFVAHLTNVTENVSAAGLESLPTVRPTATETVMPTETATPTEAVVESKIDPIFTASMEGSYKGVNVKLNIVTDKSISPKVTKLDFNPNFVNSNGENSKEALAKFVTWIFYKTKEANNGKVVTDEGYAQFLTDWADAQASNGDMTKWDKVKVSIKVDDPAVAGYNPESKDFYPMYNGPSVEGINLINEMDIVFVDTYIFHDYLKEIPGSTAGGSNGVSFNNKKISYFTGSGNNFFEGVKSDNTISNYFEAVAYIFEGKNNGYFDKTTEKILLNYSRCAITYK